MDYETIQLSDSLTIFNLARDEWFVNRNARDGRCGARFPGQKFAKSFSLCYNAASVRKLLLNALSVFNL